MAKHTNINELQDRVARSIAGYIEELNLDADISAGFNQYNALGYLEWCAEEYLRQGFKDITSCEKRIKQLKELYAMYKEIIEGEYERIRFDASPTNASGIMIKDMKEE